MFKQITKTNLSLLAAKHLSRGFRFVLFFVALTGVFLYTRAGTPTRVEAATNNELNFQARLLTASGSIVPDGSYNVEFKLYDSLAAGASVQGTCVGGGTDDCLWMETRTGGNKVVVKSGYLSVHLGDVTAFGALNWDQQLYLTMNIGGTGAPSYDGEMTPRLRLTSVPYAFQALKAEQLAKTVTGNLGQLLFPASLGQATTYNLVDPGQASVSICLSTGNCGGAGATLQSTYNNSTPARITLNSTNGGFQIRDATTPLGASLFAVQDNGGTVSYLNVDATGISVAGNASLTGNLQVDGNSTLGNASGDTLTVNATSTFNTDTNFTFAGTENLAVTSDLAGSVDVLSVVATPSSTSGTTRGLFIQQADSANTNGLDTGILVDNADTNLAVTDAISVTNSGGGGYTNILNTPSLDITGAGAITGATAITSSGTITFSSLTADRLVATTTGGQLTSTITAANLLSSVTGTTGTGNLVFSASPTFTGTLAAANITASGTLVVSGASATIGGASQVGSLILNDGSAETATISSNVLTQSTAYALPDVNNANAEICVKYGAGSGNCSGAGGGLTGNGTTNYIAKYTGTTTLGISQIFDNGTNVGIGTSGTPSQLLSIGGTTGNLTVNTSGNLVTTGSITGVGVSAGSGLLQGTGGLTVTGTAAINTTGTGTTQIGNATGTFQLDSNTIDISNAGAISGVTGYSQASGNFLQSGAGTFGTGTGAVSLNGATSVTGSNTFSVGTGATTLGGTLGVTGLGTFNGGLTVVAGQQFTNAGSTLLTAINIGNVAGGGDIGTAAATVDVSTTFNVNQTTASQTLTLDDPTSATAGRVVFVNNVGSVDFLMYGVSIGAGRSQSYMWNGTAWTPAGVDSAGAGVTSIGALDGQTKSANGAVINSSALYLQTADASFPGLVSTGSQAFAGAKTFNGQIIAGAGINLAAQTLQGTTAVINFNNFDVDASGNVDLAGTLTVGSSDQFTINATGAITAITGYTQASGAFAFSGGGNFSLDSAALDVTTAGAISGVTTLSTSGIITVGAVGTASNDTVVCRNSSNQLATCNSTFATTPASGNFLRQVPASTAENTVTPTANSVVGLTVNGTSGTAATAASILQGGAALGLNITSSSTGDGQNINLTNTTGTQANGLLIDRNGSGGTTTNLLNLTNTAGTATNALNISGTFTNLISSTNLTVTNAGNADFAGTLTAGTGNAFQVSAAGAVTAVGVDSGTGLLQGTGGLTLTGTTSINGSGTANTTIGNSSGGTVTIGAASGSDLVLQDAQWGVTGAGAATFASVNAGSGTIQTTGSVYGNDFDRTTSGTVTFGNTNATIASICNGANCDTINIGTNADADAINIGDSTDTLTIAGTLGITGATTVTGTTNINTSGSAATTIGSGTGTFALDSTNFDVTTGGALSGITGYAQASGNFLQSGAGTFGTGTGAVSLNGDTTIAAGKNLSFASGAGTFSQIFTGTTTTAATITADSLTSGKALAISSSSAGLTGNLVDISLSGNNTGNTGNILRVSNGSGASNANSVLVVSNGGTGSSFVVNDDGTDTDSTPFVISATGNVGIGVAASATIKLNIASTSTSTSGNQNGAFIQQIGTPSSAPGSALNIIGLTTQALAAGSNVNANTSAFGYTGTAGNSSTTGTLGAATGVAGQIFSANNITTANGVTSQIINAGTGTFATTNGVSIFSPTFSSSGAITTANGIYINAQDVAGVGTGYGVNQVGTNDLNYFAGNVGIGDTTPLAALTVGNGDLFQVNSSGAIAAVTGYTQASGAFAFSGAGNFSLDSAALDVTTAGAISGVTTLSTSGIITVGTVGTASNDTVVCRNSSNQLATCNSTFATTPASGNFLRQVPASTAENTVTPTANSVVGLTVNGTSGTAATALNVLQAGAATGLTLTSSSTGSGASISLTNTSGTQTNGLLIERNGASGTTTNLLNLTNTAGTATNALNISGTFTNLISSTNLTVTNAGNADFAGTLTAGTGDAFQVNGSGAITAITGYTQASGTFALNSTNATALTVANTSAAETTLIVDTSARSGSGGNLVKIGNSTGTNTATTVLQLDTAQNTDITTNVSALSGGLYYFDNTSDNTLDSVRGIVNGSVVTLCDSRGNCAGAGTTLQNAYNNSATSPEIKLNNVNNGLQIQDADTTIGATTDLLAVLSSNAASNLFRVQGNGNVGIGTSGNPAALLSVGTGTGALTVDSSGNVNTSGTLQVTGLSTLNGGLALNRTLTVNSGGTQNVGTITFSTPADTSGTNISNGLNITPSIGNATGGTNTANIINVANTTGDAQVSLNALNIGNLTGTAANEYALNIGSGWDAVLRVNGTDVINGSGQVISTGITGTLFSTNTDTASANTIVQGETLLVQGTATGIDVTHSGDTITVALDTTEITNATFGTGSGFTWTYDVGAVDPTIAFASDLVTLTAANTVLSGDLAVNGDDITSDGALTITPAAGNNLNIALSGAGDFAVNGNDLYVDTSTGFVGIGDSTPENQLTVAGNASVSGSAAIGSNASVQTPGQLLGLTGGETFTTALDIAETFTDLASTDLVTGTSTQILLDPAATVTAGTIGHFTHLQTDASNTEDYGVLAGVLTTVSHLGDGDVGGFLLGTSVGVINGGTGTINVAHGVSADIQNGGGGTITLGNAMTATFQNDGTVGTGTGVSSQVTNAGTATTLIGMGSALQNGASGVTDTLAGAVLSVENAGAADDLFGSQITITNSGTASDDIIGNDTIITNTGSVTDDIIGSRFVLNTGGSANVQDLAGSSAIINNIGTGNVTTATGFVVLTATNSGGGSITDNYGGLIATQTAGAARNIGIAILETSGGSNANVNLALGTIPTSGNYSIYNSSSDANLFGGQLIFSGIAGVDITTGTNEDLEVVANGTGVINLNDTVRIGTLAANDTDSYVVCRDASTGQLTSCDANTNGRPFVNGGNSFGATTKIGTNDAQDLIFRANNGDRLTLTQTGNLNFAQSSTIGVTATNGTLTVNSNGTGALTLDSGTTGDVNIGTGANAKTVTVGNTTGATAVTINTGTGGVNIGDNANTKTIDIGGNDADGTDTIRIATNSSTADTITIGNTTAATALTLSAGTTGGISVNGLVTASSPIGLCISGGKLSYCDVNNTNGNILQNGNTFGATVSIGSNDAQSVALRTGGSNRFIIDSTGATATFQQATTLATSTGNLTVQANGTSTLALNTTGAGTVNVATANTTTLAIGNTSASFTAESNATADLFNGATAHTVRIASGAAAQTVTLGSTNTTSTTTINGGTGGIAIQTGANAGGASGNASLQTGTGTTGSGTLSIATGNASAGTAGTINVDNGTSSSGTSNISIGTANAGSITLGRLSVTTRNDGNFTIGASAGSGTLLTNNGATVNTVLPLTNFASGGSIGTAANTVDKYTYIAVAQTTGSQTLTIPTPTANTTYGRLLYISNTGTANFGLLSSTLNAGATATLIWSNTNGAASWTFAGADGTSINNQNAAQQSANFWISGTGRADTSLQAPALERATSGTLSIGTTSNTTALTIGSSNAVGASALILESGASSTITIGSSAAARTINIGNVAAAQTITLGSTNSTSTTTINGGTGGIGIQTGNNASGASGNTSVQTGTGTTGTGTTTISTGNASAGTSGATTLSTGTGTSGTGAVTIATGNASAGASGNIGIDNGTFTSGTPTINIGTANSRSISVGNSTSTTVATFTAGAYNLNIRNTGIGINATAPTTGTVDLFFGQGASRMINVNQASSGAGNTLTIAAGQGAASNGAGGLLQLQGGAGGGTNQNGGGVAISGGAGTGTGVLGLVSLAPTSFSAAGIQTFASAGSFSITAGNVDLYSTLPITASVTGVTVTVPDPVQSVSGRVIYITARTGSSDFTLRLNSSRTPIDIAMKATSTATLIWNGTDWTAAGASSSTDLQSAYNNTLTSAGGAELVLNASGGAADGLTIRNNGTTPIIGGILEVQSSIGTNLFSVNNLGTELAANGGSETSSTWTTNWTTVGSATVARTTTAGEFVTGLAGAEITTTAAANDGIRNNLSGNPAVSTTYQVSFAAKLASGTFTTLDVRYSRDGGTDLEPCTSYSTQTLSTSVWTKITCTITTDATTASNPDLIIRQTDATARNFWIDNLSFMRNDSTTQPSNVQIGGGTNGGPITLFTLDRSTAPPVANGDTTYLGSMYYDTTTGRIQCYESDGWGACGSAPDNIITLTPEYTGAVLNGTGIGTLTADFCANQSGVLQINHTTLCTTTGEARNFYRWTSPQATEQSYSVYVTYKLPTTFKAFESANTMRLTALTTDTTLAEAYLQVFKKDVSSGTVVSCGSATEINSSADTWQTTNFGGDETACDFAGGDYIIFKILVEAEDAESVYIENLDFTYTNR